MPSPESTHLTNAASPADDGTADADASPTAAAKSSATRIVLDRATGTVGLGGAVTVTGPDVWAAARRQLSQWGMTAPKNGSYDKVDFAVTFANGFVYTGRFDLEFHGDRDLGEHIRATATWFANPKNTTTAEHIDNAAWQHVLDTLRLTD